MFNRQRAKGDITPASLLAVDDWVFPSNIDVPVGQFHLKPFHHYLFRQKNGYGMPCKW